MLLNEKKAKIRELTNNGPVPEARIPESEDSPDDEDEPPTKRAKKGVKASDSQNDEPTRGKRGAVASKSKTTAKGKAAPKKPAASAAKIKRKRTPTPEPEVKSDDEPMEDGSATEDEDGSVQGDEDRDAEVERAFGVRKDDDEGDVTEDEEL
jgi:hypothetical protein